MYDPIFTMKENKTKSSWKSVRGAFREVHLWLGLACGLIVIVVCFSGTIYVYNTEIREISLSELYKVEQPEGAAFFKPEQVIAKLEESTGGKVASVRIPADAKRSWQLTVKKDKDDRGTTYAVNPYTAEVIGDVSSAKTATTEFMRSVFSLHRWLLLDRVEEPIFGELPNRKLGSYITGTATILFTLGLLTGLVIWFPSKLKSWKQGLVIKYNANWKRLNHDLHNTMAFYSFIFLLLMGLTGPQWSFEWYREGLRKTLGTYQPANTPRPLQPQSTIPSDPAYSAKLKVSDYIASADKQLPYKGDYMISLPADSVSVVSVSKTRIGFFAPAASDRLTLDQYTAGVIHKDIFTDKPFNERVAGSIKAIHIGDVYGKFTKLLYFIACLVATSLPVTGTIIWINKLKKRYKKKRKHKKVKA